MKIDSKLSVMFCHLYCLPCIVLDRVERKTGLGNMKDQTGTCFPSGYVLHVS